MILLRQRLFSKNKKKKEKEEDSNKDLKIGAGALVAGDVANRILHGRNMRKMNENSEKVVKLAENSELAKKMIEEAKKQGTKAGTPSGIVRESILEEAKKRLGKDYTPSFLDELAISQEAEKGGREIRKHMGGSPAAYFEGLDTIVTEAEPGKSSAATIAHELGHAKNIKQTGGSKLGRLAHKIKSTPTTQQLGALGSLGVGFASGYKAEKKKEKGEKVSTLNKLTPAIAAAALAAPALVREGAATRQGIKDLKKLGASDEYIKATKKELGRAFGTYVHGIGGSYAVSGYTGRLAGRGVRRLQHKREEALRKYAEED